MQFFHNYGILLHHMGKEPDMKGSKEEKQMRAHCYSLAIDYDALTDQEVIIMCGILNKSKHLQNRESRRGKTPCYKSR